MTSMQEIPVRLPALAIMRRLHETRAPGEDARQTFDGSVISHLPECDDLMLETLSRVEEIAGATLCPVRAFAWVYESGGRVRPHTDRYPGTWSVSVPLYLSEPWELLAGGDRLPSREGFGTVMNGGRIEHGRPEYGGQAVIVVLSYQEDENIAAAERRKHAGDPDHEDERVIRIELPDFDRDGLIDWIDRHGREDDDGYSVRSIACTALPIGEALLQDLHQPVCEAVGRYLEPSHSYARKYTQGAVLRKHVDRKGLDYIVDVPVRRDDDWTIQVLTRAGWTNHPDNDPGQGLVFAAGHLPHARAHPYRGSACHQLFLHYSIPAPPPYQIVKHLLSERDAKRITSRPKTMRCAEVIGDQTWRSAAATWLYEDQWQWLYNRCRKVCGEIFPDLDFPTAIQYSEYVPGDYFRWHTDSGHDRTRHRTMTCMILLQAADAGGHLEIEEAGAPVTGVGDMLIFPSGSPHRVTDVSAGKRITLTIWLES